MKKTIKIAAVTTLALMMSFIASSAFAQTDEESLQTRTIELRETHQELKAQVDAGEITKEEAQAEWKELLEAFRTEKEAFVQERMEKIESKYQEVLEKNPEAAALLKERMDAASERRAIVTEKRDEIRAQVESGEITKSEARIQKNDLAKTQKEVYQSIRSDIQERRDNLKANRPYKTTRTQ